MEYPRVDEPQDDRVRPHPVAAELDSQLFCDGDDATLGRAVSEVALTESDKTR